MKPRIVHVLHSLGTGGMERVVVSVINQTRDRYQHAVVCLADAGAMRDEIADSSVPCVVIGKRPGKDWRAYVKLWRTLRDLRPDLVQTCNLGALDATVVAKLAGARRVVHAEHGRDVSDPLGRNRKYRRMRRWLQPCITRFVAVSDDLASWLRDDVRIRRDKIACIVNGIDCERYARSADAGRRLLADIAPPGALVIGTVGRLDAVKDQAGLIEAFAQLCANAGDAARDWRLVIVGEGAERARLEAQIAQVDMIDRIHLLGNRDDVPVLLGEFDVFVLSSIAEGIPLTVLEAMAAGLPVVATRVGGVGEVVVDGETGVLVPPSTPEALAHALGALARDAGLRQRLGAAGHARAETRFGMRAMVAAYASLYDELLEGTHASARLTARAGDPTGPGGH